VGSVSGPPLREGSAFVERLGRAGEAQELASTDEPEIEDWRGRGVDLAVPIGGGDRRLVGILLLGRKRSEQDYSPEDRRLLATVADQIAIVFENAALQKKVLAEERSRYEVLARLDVGVNLLKECPSCGRCYDRERETCGEDGVP